MVLLENEHRPQADSVGSATSDVNTNRLGGSNELVALGSIPGDESTLALTTEVLDVLGVLLGETLETSVQVQTGGSGVLDEVKTLNLVNDAAEDQSTGWVTHPGVELAVGLVRAESRVTEVVAGGLGLLGEGHHVRGAGKIPVLVGPELSGGTDTGLHLIDDEENVVALGDFAQAAEESGRGVVVTSLGLDGLDDNGGNGVVEFLDDALDVLQGALLFLGVLLGMLLKRVLQLREGSLGPVEGGNVKLVDGLAAGGGQTAEETTVEARLERHDGQLRGPRRLVLHGTGQFLLGEVNLRSTTLQLAVVHEGCLVGSLVGIRAGHGGEHLVHSLGGNLEHAAVQDMSPVMGREVTQGRSVDQRAGHLGRSSNLLEMRIVVANRDGRNLGVAATMRTRSQQGKSSNQ